MHNSAATSLQKTCPPTTLARSVLLEARRGGLPWLAARGRRRSASALAAFVSQVALTESLALQAALLAAVLRACAVFLVAAQVTASTLREIHDKGLELMLSLPLSRTTHYLGRLAGFVACGAAAGRACSPCRCSPGRRRRRLRSGACRSPARPRWSRRRRCSSP